MPAAAPAPGARRWVWYRPLSCRPERSHRRRGRDRLFAANDRSGQRTNSGEQFPWQIALHHRRCREAVTARPGPLRSRLSDRRARTPSAAATRVARDTGPARARRRGHRHHAPPQAPCSCSRPNVGEVRLHTVAPAPFGAGTRIGCSASRLAGSHDLRGWH